MTTNAEHRAKAEEYLDDVQRFQDEVGDRTFPAEIANALNTNVMKTIALAQVHATLALGVEDER